MVHRPQASANSPCDAMYATCIFCSTRLGTNEVIEEFPVGRRLAFDPRKGRLWALCPRCRQWNLSPIEERWEALESLERLYRDTATRYSTGEVGLARHAEGLEVVRIGRPELPEYASWRYGAELSRRRRRAVLIGAGAVAVGGLALGGIGTGIIAGGAVSLLNVASGGANLYRNVLRNAATLELPEGGRAVLKQRHAERAAIAREGDAWALSFPYLIPAAGLSIHAVRWAAGALNVKNDPVATLTGDEAVRAAGRILPALNRAGASSRAIDQAARFVQENPSAYDAFLRAVGTVPSAWRALHSPLTSPQNALYRLPGPVRLGLEMAAHEDAERRALEGELARLQAEWREAEEIAAIADDLLLPDRARRFFR